MTRDTTLAAASSIAEALPQLRARVLEEVRRCGGMTCDEIEGALGLKHQTASARVHELMLAGQLVDSGERRNTSSGHRAIVWIYRGEALARILNQLSARMSSGDVMGALAFGRQYCLAYPELRNVVPAEPLARRAHSIEEVEALGGYRIIYADPAWPYKQGGRGSTQRHYKTMSVRDIQALPVQRIAARDSVLFIWVTWPNLPAGLATISAWGFEYKTCAFVWLKHHEKSQKECMNGGFWTRANTEFCLLGVRGSNYPRRISKGERQTIHEDLDFSVEPEELLRAPRQEHSAKPPEARERIIRLLGDGHAKIELFARERCAGWDAWGNDPALGGPDIEMEGYAQR